MKKQSSVIVLLALLAFATSAQASHAAAPDFAAIDAWVAAQMQEARIPGLALIVVQNNGIVHVRGFGVARADQREVTPQTAFGIGSMTKSFTALAVLQLAETGALELDAPVQRYLPWFRIGDPAASARITVRHLLNQTSGLPTSAGFWDASRAAEGDLLEQRVRALQSVALAHPPGSAYEYSNANYDTLGLIVEHVSGESFEQYIQQHIFTPLGMNHTFTDAGAARQSGMAQGNQDWFGFARASDDVSERSSMAAGGIIASAEDIGRYLAAHLDAGRRAAAILSPSGFAMLHQPPDGVDSSYAMGWSQRTLGGETGLLHNGGSPAFHSTMLLMPQSGWGVAVLANVNALNIGLPQPSRQIAAGVADLLAGKPPTISGFAGLRSGWFIKLGLLAMVLWSIVTLPFELRRWRRHYAAKPPGARVLVSVLLEIVWIPIVYVALPRFAGIPFWALLRFMPDIGALMLAGVALSAVKALLRVALAARVSRRTATSAPRPRST